MKPEIILQSDLLDILFTDRNKEYGAYQLRRQYNYRLKKAILITAALVSLFSLSFYVNANFFQPSRSPVAGEPMIDVILKPMSNEPEPKEPEKLKASLKPVKQVANPLYVIVPDELATNPLSDQKDLEEGQISLITTDGEPDSGYASLPRVVSGNVDGKIIEPPVPVEPPNTEPINKPDFMPEFPGGQEGLIKYMLGHLREPGDLGAGEKLVVMTRFVVGADGSITALEVIGNTSRYDQHVLSVMRKMPKWKPGLQKGVPVAVYFTLPVTFVGLEE
jgi:protein TonB